MNKKLVMSVLSTAVVASLATTAFAAPQAGVYIGGNVKKFYKLDTMFDLSATAKTEFNNYIAQMVSGNTLNQIVYVNADGKGASIEELLNEGQAAFNEPLVESDFVDSYTEIKADGTSNGAYDPYPATEFSLEGVTALNLKQVKFTFNKAVDKQTAEDEGNYYQNGVKVTDVTVDPSAVAELQEDGKTVILTFSTSKTSNTSFAFKVNGVLEKDGTTPLDSKTFTATFTDTVKPTVAKTEYAAGKIVVTFSEPLSALPEIVRVNGQSKVKTTDYNFAAGSTQKIEITHTLAANTTASLYIAGAKDAANNEMDLFNGSVTAPAADTTKPSVVSVTPVAQNKVRVVFSEKLTDGLANGDIQIVKGATVYSHGVNGASITVAKNTAVDATEKTYDVTIDLNGATAGDGIFAEGSSSQALTVLLAENLVADAANNKNDAYTTTVTMSKDAAGPALASSKAATDKKSLEITFNEDISVVSTSGIIVTDANGVRYPVVTGESGAKVGDTKTLVVDVVSGTGEMAAGTYTVKVPAGAVKDTYGNDSAEVTTSITVGTGVADTAKPTATISTVANNKFKVEFKDSKTTALEEVGASAVNLANYKLDGAALPAGTDIYFTNANKNTVEIVLPANSINIGKVGNTNTFAILSVSGVADKAGNVLDGTTSKAVGVEDNTAATLQSASLAGDQLTLTFSENLDASSITGVADLNNTFKVMGGTTLLSTTSATYSVDGNKLYITYSAGNWADVKAASTVTVETYATPVLEDANDLDVKGAVKVTVTK